MLKWILGTVVGGILGIAGYFFYYLGAYKPVLVSEQQVLTLHLLYVDHVGPYHKIAPLIIGVEQWAEANKIDCHLSFGEYFDDPRVIEEGRLRSRAGCLLEEPQNFPADLKLPEGMKRVDLPPANRVIAVFEGSPAIGPMKVYPKVEEYFAAKNAKMGPSVIEEYEVHSEKSMTTRYLFPFADAAK